MLTPGDDTRDTEEAPEVSEPIYITRNGLRVWQGISTALALLFVGAVSWNFAQIQSLGERLAALPPGLADAMRNRDDALEREISDLRVIVSEIRANQQRVLRQLEGKP